MTLPPNPLCYDCNHPLEPGQERCPLCGAFVRARDRNEKIQAELHKDRWSAPPDPSARAKTISTASPAALAPASTPQRPSRPPVSVGFEGRRGRMQKFDATIGVNVRQIESSAPLAEPAQGPARTLAGIPMPLPPTAEASSPLGTRTMAWQPVAPPIVRPQSDPPRRAVPRDPTPDPSAAIQIESLSIERARVSQMPKPVRGDLIGERGNGASVRMSADIPPFSLASALAVSSVFLLVAWLAPDLVQPPFTLPVQLVASTRGLDLLGLLSVPLVGSLLLALAIAPLSDAVKSVIALPLALLGLVAALLFTPLVLPLEGWIVLAAAVPMIAGAALAHKLSEVPLIGHIVAAAVPTALLVVAIMGFALGRFPLAYAAALKPPLLLWAFTQTAALSLATLIWPWRHRGRS